MHRLTSAGFARPGWVLVALALALGMAEGGSNAWGQAQDDQAGSVPGQPAREVPLPVNPSKPLPLPLPPGAPGQPPGETPTAPAEGGIFGRLEGTRAFRESEQIMVGATLWAQPVAMADARLTENQGLRYAHYYRPRAMVYGGWGWQMDSATWVPKDPTVAQIQVFQFAYDTSLNFWLRRTAVLRLGVGLGFMSGLVRYNDARVFQTRLEPFVPLTLGLGAYVGESVMVEWSGSLSAFFGPGPVMSLWRQGLAIGFNF